MSTGRRHRCYLDSDGLLGCCRNLISRELYIFASQTSTSPQNAFLRPAAIHFPSFEKATLDMLCFHCCQEFAVYSPPPGDATVTDEIFPSRCKCHWGVDLIQWPVLTHPFPITTNRTLSSISDKSSRATNLLGEPLNIVNVIVNYRMDISSPSRRF